MTVHQIGMSHNADWDSLIDLEPAPKLAQLNCLLAKFARNWYGIKPPFAPRMQMTPEDIHEALQSENSQNFLESISLEWSQGRYPTYNIL